VILSLNEVHTDLIMNSKQYCLPLCITAMQLHTGSEHFGNVVNSGNTERFRNAQHRFVAASLLHASQLIKPHLSTSLWDGRLCGFIFYDYSGMKGNYFFISFLPAKVLSFQH
jgi:hypothetical protein